MNKTKMIYQFLTPPRIGRKFKTESKGITKHWEVIDVIRKISNTDRRYEVKAELIVIHKKQEKNEF